MKSVVSVTGLLLIVGMSQAVADQDTGAVRADTAVVAPAPAAQPARAQLRFAGQQAKLKHWQVLREERHAALVAAFNGVLQQR